MNNKKNWLINIKNNRNNKVINYNNNNKNNIAKNIKI